MRSWRMLPRALAFVMVLALVVPVGAQRPDPHAGSVSTPQATPAVTDCSGTEQYARAVLAAFGDAGQFLDFLDDFEASWGTLSKEDAEEVIASGDALVAELSALEPPQAYQPAHDGIISMVQFNIDVARFYAIDTSVVPDIEGEGEAWQQIDAGERAMAEACPEEVAELGGHLVFEPAPLPEEIEDLPE